MQRKHLPVAAVSMAGVIAAMCGGNQDTKPGIVIDARGRSGGRSADAGHADLGAGSGSEALAYTLAQIGDGALNDTLNGQALVVFALAQGHTGAEFDAVLDGRRLRIQWDGEAYSDEETGSR